MRASSAESPSKSYYFILPGKIQIILQQIQLHFAKKMQIDWAPPVMLGVTACARVIRHLMIYTEYYLVHKMQYGVTNCTRQILQNISSYS